ncbi:MAG: hypothetical protein JWM19_878 [Actinomycetia bacterium]|nr:hypothetical protein [Actinomycetes bacterium]
MSESPEFPERPGDLSTYALNHAIGLLSDELKDHPNEDLRRALAVIRLVAPMRRQVPWYGAAMAIPGRTDSVQLGTVIRNAFEALGDDVDVLGEGGVVLNNHRSWFAQFYAPAWHQGKRDYDDFLDHLFDPVRHEEEDERNRLSHAQAGAMYAQVKDYLGRKQ